MLDFEMIKQVLIVAIGSSIITTEFIQKVKESLKTKKYLPLISFAVSMLIGTAFALRFSDLEIYNCLWVGLISWIGADVIYKTFEDKLFTPFKKINEVVEVPKANEITFDKEV